jgi:hypothetical protein
MTVRRHQVDKRNALCDRERPKSQRQNKHDNLFLNHGKRSEDFNMARLVLKAKGNLA